MCDYKSHKGNGPSIYICVNTFNQDFRVLLSALAAVASETAISQRNSETGVIILVVTDDIVHADDIFQV